jgi:hypothetical protein
MRGWAYFRVDLDLADRRFWKNSKGTRSRRRWVANVRRTSSSMFELRRSALQTSAAFTFAASGEQWASGRGGNLACVMSLDLGGGVAGGVVIVSLSLFDNSEAAAFRHALIAAIHLTDPTFQVAIALLPILDSKGSKPIQHGYSSTQVIPLVSTQTPSADLLSNHRKACI